MPEIKKTLESLISKYKVSQEDIPDSWREHSSHSEQGLSLIADFADALGFRSVSALKQFMESLTPVVALIDPEQKVVAVNSAGLNIMELPESKVLGLSASDLLGKVGPEEKILDQQMEERSQGLSGSYEIRMINPNGREYFLKIHSRPVHNRQGVFLGSMALMDDVTEVSKARENKKLTDRMFQEIASNFPGSAIWIVDRNRKFKLLQGPLLDDLGMLRQELKGSSIELVDVIYSGAAYLEVVNDVFKGDSQLGEISFKGKTIMVWHYPVTDGQTQEVLFVMSLFIDVSDRKSIQIELEKRARELKRSNDELERFAYIASHDLQGPLRTIASYLRLIEQRSADKLDKDGLEFIRFSIDAAKRMQKIIQDLLNYSRITSTPRPFQLLDLHELTENVIRILESSIRSRNAKVEILGKLPSVIAQPVLLSQLLQNLIDNGMKFSRKEQPIVSIFCTEDANEYKVSVSDNGIGIKEEYAGKIFQIFQRLHTENEFPGSGIGLAICQKIVHIHQGQIDFLSEQGKGTTFYFTIPKNLKTD
jgi:PAS domain S-box-containing protein